MQPFQYAIYKAVPVALLITRVAGCRFPERRWVALDWHELNYNCAGLVPLLNFKIGEFRGEYRVCPIPVNPNTFFYTFVPCCNFRIVRFDKRHGYDVVLTSSFPYVLKDTTIGAYHRRAFG